MSVDNPHKIWYDFYIGKSMKHWLFTQLVDNNVDTFVDSSTFKRRCLKVNLVSISILINWRVCFDKE
jgi:hypothetical protein